MTPQEIKEQAENSLEFKFCKGCSSEKKVSEFHKKSAAKDGLAYHCKDCAGECSRKHYEKNKDLVYSRYLKRKEENPDKYKKYAKKWRDSNRDLTSFFNAKYRALKKNAQPVWLSESDKREIRGKFTEAKTLEKRTGVPHHVDHVVPLNHPSVCGLHVPWNLEVIPAEDNIRKSNKYGCGFCKGVSRE